jgi:hypothetical protein
MASRPEFDSNSCRLERVVFPEFLCNHALEHRRTRALSSVGKSSRLIIDWSQVQALQGPLPFPGDSTGHLEIHARRSDSLYTRILDAHGAA